MKSRKWRKTDVPDVMDPAGVLQSQRGSPGRTISHQRLLLHARPIPLTRKKTPSPGRRPMQGLTPMVTMEVQVRAAQTPVRILRAVGPTMKVTPEARPTVMPLDAKSGGRRNQGSPPARSRMMRLLKIQ